MGQAKLIQIVVAVSVAFAALTPSLFAQDYEDVLAVIPLEGEDVAVRPEIPRPATLPAAPATQPAAAEEERSPYLLGDLWGARTQLSDHGLDVEALLTVDVARNVRGGVDTGGSAVSHLFGLSVTVDAEKMLGWKGTSAYLSLHQEHGAAAFDEAGDFQGVSGIGTGNRTLLSEAWLQQVLFDGKLLLKAGRLDANGDFGFAEYSADFVNSSIGYPLSSLVMPTYPDAGLGADFFIYPNEWFYFGAGVFEGEVVGEGVYAIGEAGVVWKLRDGTLTGRVRAGGWHHTGTFEKFTGGTRSGTSGVYALLDQKVWRENPDLGDDDQGVAIFFIADASDEDISLVAAHVGCGAVWKGMLSGRDEDVAGAGVTVARFSDKPAAGFTDDAEVALEAFYRFQLTPYFSVKPDLQYVVNPGGTGARDAVVAAVRLELSF